jgi:hypothetical protein
MCHIILNTTKSISYLIESEDLAAVHLSASFRKLPHVAGSFPASLAPPGVYPESSNSFKASG